MHHVIHIVFSIIHQIGILTMFRFEYTWLMGFPCVRLPFTEKVDFYYLYKECIPILFIFRAVL